MTKIFTFLLIIGFISCQSDMKINEEKTKNGIKLIYEPDNYTTSGWYINYVPKDPYKMVLKEDAIQIIKILIEKYPNCLINSELDSIVSFVDCGGGLEHIRCQYCGQEFETEYWQDLMNKSYENHFSDLCFVTNCCNRRSDLNSIDYDADCGFAKSVFSINNPEYEESIIEEVLLRLKKQLDIDFRVIVANY